MLKYINFFGIQWVRITMSNIVIYFRNIVLYKTIEMRRIPCFVSVNVNVNKLCLNTNITQSINMPKEVKAAINCRSFDHVDQSNRQIFIDCLILRYHFFTSK